MSAIPETDRSSAQHPQVIHLAGELDWGSTADLGQRLMSIAESSTAGTIVLDLSAVSFLDAHCVRDIVRFWNALTARDQQLWVAGLHGVARKIFDILELTPMLARRTDDDDGVREASDRA
ncbi:STAS domain-containing protein [Actinoplanes oblitus]|uniref:STAS domain-containing protein n=1 Tax=Actinoplanes oblitus TaxID=3040509 RepID=A0ABY8W7G5_9ACTN|nr:STAS domain-containing protein [Actinoplanes oblitus]WIM93608.1 STAS domain-containing protein [Actinoplanes oblitus]